jgi:hypothetical protein
MPSTDGRQSQALMERASGGPTIAFFNQKQEGVMRTSQASRSSAAKKKRIIK